MAKFLTSTGFSIEIENFNLLLRGRHNGFPLYESIGGIVTAIALVKKPALEELSIAESKKKGKKRTLISPVMIPNKFIYRYDENPNGIKEEYFCFFSEETIKKLQESFIGEIKIGH